MNWIDYESTVRLLRFEVISMSIVFTMPSSAISSKYFSSAAVPSSNACSTYVSQSSSQYEAITSVHWLHVGNDITINRWSLRAVDTTYSAHVHINLRDCDPCANHVNNKFFRSNFISWHRTGSCTIRKLKSGSAETNSILLTVFQ